MKNSILSKIIEAKKYFTEYAASSADFVSWFCGGNSIINQAQSWADENGVTHCIEMAQGVNTITWTATSEAGQSVRSLLAEEVQAILNGEAESLSQITNGMGMTLAAAVKDLACGSQRNEALAKLTSLFTSKSKVKATDLYAALEQGKFSGLDNLSLIQLISSVQDSDGYISSYAWMQILGNCYGDYQKQIESGSMQLDTTQPRYVSYLWTTVLPTALTAFGTILVAIGGVVGKIVGVVVSILGTIAGAILNTLFGDLVRVKPYCSDPSSVTDYLDGPGYASQSKFKYTVPADYAGLAYLYEAGPMDYYVFQSPDGYLNINSFLDLGLDVGAAVQYCMTTLTITAHTASVGALSTQYIKIDRMNDGNPSYRLKLPDNVYLSMDQRMDRRTSGDDAISFNIIGHIIVLGLLQLDLSVDNYWHIQYGGYSVGGEEQEWAQKYPVWLAMNFLWENKINSTTLADFITDHISDYGFSLVHNYFIHVRETFDTDWVTAPDNPTISQVTIPVEVDGSDPQYSLQSFKTYLRRVPFFMTYTHSGGYVIEGASEEDYVDYIPTDRCYSLNNTTINEIIKFAAVTAIIVAGTVVIGVLANKAIKKIKFKKRISSVQSLQAAAENYYSQPTDENLDAFYKAQKSYNFKAKLLGWPAYDPVNSWFEADSDNGADQSIGIGQLYQLDASQGTSLEGLSSSLSNQASSLAGMASNMSGQASNIESLANSYSAQSTLVDEVLHSIKG